MDSKIGQYKKFMSMNLTQSSNENMAFENPNKPIYLKEEQKVEKYDTIKSAKILKIEESLEKTEDSNSNEKLSQRLTIENKSDTLINNKIIENPNFDILELKKMINEADLYIKNNVCRPQFTVKPNFDFSKTFNSSANCEFKSDKNKDLIIKSKISSEKMPLTNKIKKQNSNNIKSIINTMETLEKSISNNIKTNESLINNCTNISEYKEIDFINIQNDNCGKKYDNISNNIIENKNVDNFEEINLPEESDLNIVKIKGLSGSFSKDKKIYNSSFNKLINYEINKNDYFTLAKNDDLNKQQTNQNCITFSKRIIKIEAEITKREMIEKIDDLPIKLKKSASGSRFIINLSTTKNQKELNSYSEKMDISKTNDDEFEINDTLILEKKNSHKLNSAEIIFKTPLIKDETIEQTKFDSKIDNSRITNNSNFSLIKTDHLNKKQNKINSPFELLYKMERKTDSLKRASKIAHNSQKNNNLSETLETKLSLLGSIKEKQSSHLMCRGTSIPKKEKVKSVLEIKPAKLNYFDKNADYCVNMYRKIEGIDGTNKSDYKNRQKMI